MRWGRIGSALWRSLPAVLTACLAANVAAAGYAVEFVDRGRTLEVSCVATFTPDDLILDKLDQYDTVRLERGSRLTRAGEPDVPTVLVRIALPEGMAVGGARVVHSEAIEIPGEFLLSPTQPLQPISVPLAKASFVPPDAAAYSSSDAIPDRLVRLERQADLAGQPIAVVRLCPVQYVPARRKLLLHTSLKIVLDGVPGYVCGDHLSPAASATARDSYARLLAGHVVNPQDVRLREGMRAPTSRGVEPGNYDYVIIAKPNWVDDFAPLAEWKTRKGVPARVVSRNWIYDEAGYTGTNVERIRAFVQDAHATWGATYFLLGGDTNTLPYHEHTLTAGSETDDIPNDTYYADFDGDWMCEVHVGRASVRNPAAIATFIDKVLTYEKSAPGGDYGKSAALFGFDLSDWAHEGESCKQYIKNALLPSGWVIDREYDTEEGDHFADVLGYLNAGYNLVNHADHSSTHWMGAGATHHGDGLSPGNMSGLTNGDRQSILYSLGCWACNYAADECIAEAFVRNAGGGGVAFVGNSRYGWYLPGSGDEASCGYDRAFFRSLFDQEHYTLGACFSDHKNDAFEVDDHSKWIFTELTLLGDPELPILTANPAPLTVTHADFLYRHDLAEFSVHVASGDSALADARVCLWKDGDLYEIATTDLTGRATFEFAPDENGTLLVTAFKRNYLPYEGSADVIEAVSGDLDVYVGGEGEVTLDPPGGSYPPGQSVVLSAAPAPGWAFDHWEGALRGPVNPETIVLYGEKAVTAVFSPDCNANGIPDHQDIAVVASWDCNANGVPDECEMDLREGLAGAYYRNASLIGTPGGRVDGMIDFNWGSAAPRYGFSGDWFSVRWTGFVITPDLAGDYTFFTRTDDGVRLWVANQLLIDQWVDQVVTEHAAMIALEAGQAYPLVMEYYENTGDAIAELRWQPPGMDKVIIPSAHLVTGRDCNENGRLDSCDFAADLQSESPSLSPLGGEPQTYEMLVPPPAIGDVTLTFEAFGDLRYSSETVDVDINGVPVGTVYGDAHGSFFACTQDQIDSLVVPAQAFNDAVAGSDAVITMTPSPDITPDACVEASWIQVHVAYAAAVSQDADGDAIPDECQGPGLCPGDMNCDGIVDFGDIDPFVAALGCVGGDSGCWPGPCSWLNGDCNTDGTVNFDDIDPFVGLIGTTCP